MQFEPTKVIQAAPWNGNKFDHSLGRIDFRQVTPLVATLPVPSNLTASRLTTINENDTPNLHQRRMCGFDSSLRFKHRGYCIRSLENTDLAAVRDAKLNCTEIKGSKTTFSPGFSDVVNDTMRMDSDPAMLTSEYRSSDFSRNRLLGDLIRRRCGTDVPSMQRILTHTNYTRVGFNDILMFHPSAWGFPETDLKRAFIGSQRAEDALHGWLWQETLNADAEMVDVAFSLTIVVRRIPEPTFHAIATGAAPTWLSGISSITAETGAIERLASSFGVKWDMSRILQAGLLEPSQVHINVAEIRNARLVEPEALNYDMKLHFCVNGLQGLQMCLSNRANIRTNITPSQIEEMAFQLGVLGDFHYYWLCFSIMNFPLPHGWGIVLKDGMRMYLNHKTQKQQYVHPYQPHVLEITECLHQAQALWDTRGAVNISCDDCSAPASVLFCLQCTGFMCAQCFLRIHSSRNWHHAYPYPGCRYLSEDEVKLLSPFLPLTNIGFCNRRRFLARRNQSDKTGACQCEWLHFDSIEALNAIAYEFSDDAERRIVRSIEDGKGFYYNFATGMATEDPMELISETKKVQARALALQAWFRGARCRKRQAADARAAIMIQKNFRMIIARRRYKYYSRGSPLFHWFERLVMLNKRDRMFTGLCRFQALVRQVQTRAKFLDMRRSAVRIQALWRASHLRHALAHSRISALRIQSSWRGYHYGYKRVLRMHCAAIQIQAVARGVRCRLIKRLQTEAAVRIQAFVRGFLSRTRTKERFHAALRIQSSWRRFNTIIQFKFDAVGILSGLMHDYDDTARLRAMTSAVVQIQRHVRRHQQRRAYVQLTNHVKKCEQPVSKALSQIITSIAGLDSPIHYWFRYLPKRIQDRLKTLKNIIQYGTCRCGPGLAASVVVTILKSLVQSFPQSYHVLERIAHSVSHIFAGMKSAPISSVLRTAAVGTGLVPARIEEPLVNFMIETARPLMIPSECSLRIEDSPFGVDVLKNCRDRDISLIRSMCLSDCLLIPFREFLAQPRLVLDSRLAFQGVDADKAFQVFDIISYEMGIDLPITDLTRKQTCGESVTFLKEWMEHGKPSEATSKNGVLLDRKDFRFFTRDRIWAILQGLGGLMRSNGDDRQIYARHVEEVESILKEARMAFAQEHYEFMVGTVIMHFTIRALIIKTLWERAANVIQTRFRYYVTRGRIRRFRKPTITIQRFWRGLAVALRLVRLDRAALTIQNNYRIIRAGRRNEELSNAVSLIQAIWRGAIQRKHLSRMSVNAVVIQSIFRGHIVRLYLGSSEGRALRRAFQDKLVAAGKSPEERESLFLSYRGEIENHKRRVLQSKRGRARIIQRKLDQYRNALQSRSKKQAVQIPQRWSAFEPHCFARRRGFKSTTTKVHFQSRVNEVVQGAGSIIQSLKMSFS